VNELQHRVPKQERILAVVEPPRHFVKVGRQMACSPWLRRWHEWATIRRSYILGSVWALVHLDSTSCDRRTLSRPVARG